MSDERAFLDHIIAHPDDDAPRLVFADWLDERGRHDRAEFIRVQCELARLPAWDARRVRLTLREGVLQQRLAGELAAELPDLPERRPWNEYRRGFRACVAFDTPAELRDRLPRWAASVPLEAVHVSRWGASDEGGELPTAPSVHQLSLCCDSSDGEMRSLVGWSPLSTLRVLSIEGEGIVESLLRRLLVSPSLHALRVVPPALSGHVPRILADIDPPALEELDISGVASYVGDAGDVVEGIADLAAWPGFARLRALILDGNALGATGLRMLLASPYCVGLKFLSLQENRLDAGACAGFVNAASGLRLETLDIGFNPLSDAGAAALASAACLSELKELHVGRCAIGRDGAAALARAPFMPTLRVLRAELNSFGPGGLRAILAAAPPHLHTLDLTRNDIGNAGLASLAESPASNVFLDLDLSQNNRTAASSQILGSTRYLQNLLRLTLTPAWFSRSDGTALIDSPLGRRLADSLGDSIPF